jgi:hypothetical protein
MMNVMQQVGGSLGLAILVTAYTSATGSLAHLSRLAQAHAVVHGMASAFTLAAALDVLALAVIVTVIRGRARVPAAEMAPEPVTVTVSADG